MKKGEISTYLDGLEVIVEAGDQGTLLVEQTGGTLDAVEADDPFDKRLGEVLLLPLRTMSRIRVSMGVLPTSRKKKTCSMTWDDTVLNDGNRSKSLPNRVGWLGYWVRQYSSKAHWDFSCSCSMAWAFVKPGASA